MGVVFRNGIPPKRLHFKMTRVFSDLEFNEDLITKWSREHLSSPMQYDFTIFNGDKGKLNRTIELTVWFQTKTDADRFRKQWM